MIKNANKINWMVKTMKTGDLQVLSLRMFLAPSLSPPRPSKLKKTCNFVITITFLSVGAFQMKILCPPNFQKHLFSKSAYVFHDICTLPKMAFIVLR